MFIGYRKALEDNHIKYDSSLVFPCEKVTFEEGYQFAEKIHEQKIEIDALFTITDLVAIGAITYFNEIGVKIPEQISVVGFSNNFVSVLITPSLTSINQPGYKMGEKALKLLFKEIKSNKKGLPFKPETIVLPTKIIKRNSTFNLVKK